MEFETNSDKELYNSLCKKPTEDLQGLLEVCNEHDYPVLKSMVLDILQNRGVLVG